MAFVPTVVPCARTLIDLRSSGEDRLNLVAALSIAFRTPSEKSEGVDGDLAIVSLPSSSINTQSVKVPPISNPQMKVFKSSSLWVRQFNQCTTRLNHIYLNSCSNIYDFINIVQ